MWGREDDLQVPPLHHFPHQPGTVNACVVKQYQGLLVQWMLTSLYLLAEGLQVHCEYLLSAQLLDKRNVAAPKTVDCSNDIDPGRHRAPHSCRLLPPDMPAHLSEVGGRQGRLINVDDSRTPVQGVEEQFGLLLASELNSWGINVLGAGLYFFKPTL